MQPLDPATEQALIAHLLQFVRPAKQARMEEVLRRRTSRIRVVLEDVFQPHNASAVMRSCECFGIQHLHVVENRYRYRINRDVAMGSWKWIQLHRHRRAGADNTMDCIRELRAAGYRIAATSPAPGSTPPGELSLRQPLALWFGNEEAGLSGTVLREADLLVHVPMHGFTQSLNISVSAAICLHDLRRRLAEEGLDNGLPEDEQRAVTRRWLKGLLKRSEIIEKAFLEGRQRPGAGP